MTRPFAHARLGRVVLAVASVLYFLALFVVADASAARSDGTVDTALTTREEVGR